MNKTGGELSILGDVPPSLSKEFNTSITDDSSIIHNDTNTSNGIDKTISNSIIDNNNTALRNSIDREEEVSQIVNSALEKARSRADDEGDINAMDNFITVTEIPTIPPKSPKIQEATSNELPILESNLQSNELPILESNLQSTDQKTIDNSNINGGEINGVSTTADQIIDKGPGATITTNIHIGKIGNPIGSLGTLWDSVTTEQEMVNVNVVHDNRGDGKFCLLFGIIRFVCVCGGLCYFSDILAWLLRYLRVDCYLGLISV